MNTKDLKLFTAKLGIILAIAVLIYLLYVLKSLVFIVCISVFLTLLFTPFVRSMKKYNKIPEWLGILLVYLLILVFVGILLVAIVPILYQGVFDLVEWAGTVITNLEKSYASEGIAGLGVPDILAGPLDRITKGFNLESFFVILRDNLSNISTFLSNNLQSVAQTSFGLLATATNAVIQTFFVFIVTFFLILERKAVVKTMFDALPKSWSKYLDKKKESVLTIVHSWLKGQLRLALAMGTITFIGLWILHAVGVPIHSKGSLAIISGMMEFVPYAGPVIAFTPMLAIALGLGGWQPVIGVLILYVILQNIEGNFLVPWIMGKSLSLSPLFVLLIMLIGAVLAGFIGVILAVPIAGIVHLFFTDWLKWKNKKATK